MFEKLRKPGRAKNFFAYIIFGIICFSFVFIGMGSDQFGMTGGGPAAMVNKEPISFADFRERYSRIQNQYKGQLDGLPAAQRQKFAESMKTRALEDLINAELMSQAAVELGIYVSDEETRKYILEIPIFQKDDRFQRQYYENFLSYRKISAEKFENEIRKELSLNRVRDLIEKSLIVPRPVKDLDDEVKSTKVNIAFLRLEPSKIKNKVLVGDEEAEKFVKSEENQEAIKSYYSRNKSKYTQEEEVKARHILIKYDEKTPNSEQDALEKIKSIAEEAKTKDFSELASKYSEDPGSKVKGGDLGFFGRKRMVPEFENVAFQLEVGKVSEPVKSPFGYHLIKVEGKKEKKVKELKEVEKAIAMELLRDRKYDETMKEVDELAQKGSMGSVAAWAKKYDLKVDETGLFHLGQENVPKLGADEHVVAEVLKLNEAGKMVTKAIPSQGSRFLVQLKEIKKDKLQDLPKEVAQRFDIKQSTAASAVFSEWADQVKEGAKIERNPQILAN